MIGARGTLSRIYTLSSYLGEGDRITITTDASPLGLGAFLVITGTIAEFAFDLITLEDQRRLLATTAGPSGQQVWEALAVLAALRLWKHAWMNRRIVLEVKSDSATALVLLIKLKATGIGAGLISREVA